MTKPMIVCYGMEVVCVITHCLYAVLFRASIPVQCTNRQHVTKLSQSVHQTGSKVTLVACKLQVTRMQSLKAAAMAAAALHWSLTRVQGWTQLHLLNHHHTLHLHLIQYQILQHQTLLAPSL